MQPLTWFDLSWLDLSWHDLSWLDLSWLDLSWLDLSWLDLSWLDLSWLDLTWYTFQTPSRLLPDTLQATSRHPLDTFQTPSRHRPDTLQIPSRHPLDTHKTPSKFQLPSFHGSKRNYASGGWVGGRVVPRTFYSHVVVQLASLQDFKQSWNSQVGPSVAILLNAWTRNTMWRSIVQF